MKIKGLLIKKILKIASISLSLLLSIGLFLFLAIYPSKRHSVNLASPSFTVSHESGVYKEPFELRISTINNNFYIRYTLDGSEPTSKSNLYTKPIKIDKSSVVRFAFFLNENIEGDSNTKVYVLNKHTVPTVFLVTDPANLWDPVNGIYVVGEDKKTPNYTRKGDAWQKLAELFYFDENGNLEIEMPVEIRISGGTTRNHPQKTLRVCAKESLGFRSINYDFFGDGASKQHKCILLRNSGNDWDRTMFRDILAQSLIYETDVDTQQHKTSVLYLNGDYWGIHNIREFYDDQYLKYKYGTKKESVVIIEPDRKNGGAPVVRDGSPGDGESYQVLLENIDDYNYLKSHIDLNNYLDYFLINIYSSNSDWPDNNIRTWRLKTDEFSSMSTQPLDGKWRWLLFDLDSSFSLFKSSNYESNTLEYATKKFLYVDKSKKNETWPNAIIRTLLSNEEFKISFINRYADLLNTNFSEENVLKSIENLKQIYEPEIPMHISKWGGKLDKGGKPAFENIEKWESNIQVLRDFALNRPKYARQHVVDKFELSGTYKITLKSLNIEGGRVKINSIDSENNLLKNELIYFNNIPITIEAKPSFGWKFISWGTEDIENKRKQVFTSDNDVYLDPIFELTWWGKLINKL